MKFEEALAAMREGKAVYRSDWPHIDPKDPRICVFIQFPDEHSKMTKPYLCMRKVTSAQKVEFFPLDLSCESIFSDQWEICEVNPNDRK